MCGSVPRYTAAFKNVNEIGTARIAGRLHKRGEPTKPAAVEDAYQLTLRGSSQYVTAAAEGTEPVLSVEQLMEGAKRASAEALEKATKTAPDEYGVLWHAPIP